MTKHQLRGISIIFINRFANNKTVGTNVHDWWMFWLPIGKGNCLPCNRPLTSDCSILLLIWTCGCHWCAMRFSFSSNMRHSIKLYPTRYRIDFSRIKNNVHFEGDEPRSGQVLFISNFLLWKRMSSWCWHYTMFCIRKYIMDFILQLWKRFSISEGVAHRSGQVIFIYCFVFLK